jgi:hypothetical protein
VYALFIGVIRFKEVQESIPKLCTYYMFYLLHEAHVKNGVCIDDRKANVHLTNGLL